MRALALIVGALAVGAAPASAATVEVVERADPLPTATAVVRAAPGETNVLSYAISEGGHRVHVRDYRLPLTAGRGCEQVEESTVRCTLGAAPDRSDPPRPSLEVDLGDGNDAIEGFGEPAVALNGGAGDDYLASYGPGPGVLDGGPGADRLQGSNGDDTLRGGTGPDRLESGWGGADTLEGDPPDAVPAPDRMVGSDDPEPDTVTYAGRPAPAYVDLTVPGQDGAAGEGDDLVGIEHVVGGLGGDVIVGDDGPNRLDGGAGNDVVAGRGGTDLIAGAGGDDLVDGDAGDDLMQGGAGRDRVGGGDGNDMLELGGAAAGRGDRALCGAGEDRVRAFDRSDVVLPDCERMELLGLLLGQPLATGAGRYRVAAAPVAGPVGCRVVVRVATPRRSRRSARVLVASARQVGVGRTERRPRPGAVLPGRVRVDVAGGACGSGGFQVAR